MPEKGTWEKIVDAISKNMALLLVILGIALAVVAANSGYQKAWLSIPDIYWRVFVAVMGVVVGGFGVRLIWRGGGDIDTFSIAKECELKITSPISRAELDSKIEMQGTYKKKLPKRVVAAIIERFPNGRHWFKEQPLVFAEKEKQWSATIYLGGRKEKRTLSVVILGEPGEALREYFVDVKKLGQGVSVGDLTPDIAPCDEVEIYFRGKVEDVAPLQRASSTG